MGIIRFFLRKPARERGGKRNKKISPATLAAVNSDAVLPGTSNGGTKLLGFDSKRKHVGSSGLVPGPGARREPEGAQHCIFGTLLLV